MPMLGEYRGHHARGPAWPRLAAPRGNGRARTDREGHMSEREFGGRGIGAFGVGLALGLAIGAGVALLSAPRSGEETRDLLRRQARRMGSRVNDQIDDLRHDLHRSARRGTRSLRKGLARGRRLVEDAADRYTR